MFKKVWTTTLLLLLKIICVDTKLYPDGLGGASIKILCAPQVVSLGSIVNINVLYDVDINRSTDLHFDLLQEPEKKWLAGSQILLEENNGSVSINMTLPESIEDVSQVLWKVFITPQGQDFPNMLAETGIAPEIIGEGEKKTDDCPPILTESNTVIKHNIDSIWIESVNEFSVTINYSLVSISVALIDISVIDNNTNEWLFGMPSIQIEKTENTKQTFIFPSSFFIPSSWFTRNNSYIEAVLVPIGKTWDSRLAQDRFYLKQI